MKKFTPDFTIKDKDSKTRIFKAIAMYNNRFYWEEWQDYAFNVLLEEFNDILSQEWEIDMAESWHSEEYIDECRNTGIEEQWKADILTRFLTPM